MPLDISVVLDMHDEVVQAGFHSVDLFRRHEVEAHLAGEGLGVVIMDFLVALQMLWPGIGAPTA